jgi:hypothetical protein
LLLLGCPAGQGEFRLWLLGQDLGRGPADVTSACVTLSGR